ncbi:UPF0606 protein KIAA1549L homolog [Gracilinanus agilis]|uniref:UPF0606 protein KIAA1549L homolog n=1 Tax=Gracilinanus agilis TaxID=191870 RepID=UPI001CFD72CB|nr:UPF0606 protein KIAA1549L homolog [Gracilinanus agilis]
MVQIRSLQWAEKLNLQHPSPSYCAETCSKNLADWDPRVKAATMTKYLGTNHPWMNVTLTPHSFANLRRSTSTSPTWPSWELKSSSNVDRLKDPMRHFPENASLLQIIRSTLAHPPSRTRSQTDFSSTLYQGSGHSASLDPSKELAQALAHPRPRDSDEVADVSGLPQHNMSVPLLSTTPSVTLSSAVLSSQLMPLGPPSIPNQHTPGSDIVSALPSPSLSSSVPGSPHTIIFSKPTKLPVKVPSFPQRAPHDSSHRESTDNPLDPLSSKTNHPPSRKAQELTDNLSLDFSGSTTAQYSRLVPSERLNPESPSTSVFVNSMPDIPHLSSSPVAPGSLPWLPSQTPTLLKFTDVSSSGPVHTQPFKSRVTKRAHGSVSWPAFESSSEMSEVGSRLVQSIDGRTASMERRHSPSIHATLNKPVHLSPASEEVGAGSHSVKRTPSSLGPATLSLVAVGGATATHATSSSATKNEPASPTTSDFPWQSWSRASPLLMAAKKPTFQEKDKDGTPADLFLMETGQSSVQYSTTSSLLPGKEGSLMGAFMENEKANMVASPTQEATSQSTLSETMSDLTTNHIPAAIITEPQASLTLSELPVPPVPPTERSFMALGSSPIVDAESEIMAAPTNPARITTSAPKQEAAFLSSAHTLHSSVPARTQESTSTAISQGFLSGETESHFLESAITVLAHQKDYDLNGHEKSPTSSVTHSAKVSALNSPNSAAKVTHSPDVRDAYLHPAFAKEFSVQHPSLNLSTEQATHQSRVTTIGNSTDLWPTNHKNITRDLETSLRPLLATHEAFATLRQHLSRLPSKSPPPLTSLPPASSDLTSPISLQEMFPGETETRTSFASTRHPSPMINTSVPFQSGHKPWTFPAAVLPTLTPALFKTAPKVPLTSPVPENWTVATAHASSLVPGSQRTAYSSSVSPEVVPTVASTSATRFIGKYTLSALSAALVSKGTGNKVSVPSAMVAKSTATPVLAKNGTPIGTPGSQVVAGTIKTVETPTVSPFAPVTPRTTQANVITAAARLSTTHFPGKSQAMQSDFHKSTNSETPKTSTTFPLTIMAALTSITTSGKVTKLPPLPVENTSTALPVTSTTAVTTGKTTLNLECQMSKKLMVKTVWLLRGKRSTALELSNRRASSAEKAEEGLARLLASPVRLSQSPKLLAKGSLWMEVLHIIDLYNCRLSTRLASLGDRFPLMVYIWQAEKDYYYRASVLKEHMNLVEILEHSHNVTVGYYVTKGKLVYIPAVVVETLLAYGISNVTADLKQHLANLQSVAVLASPWNPQPAYAFQLKTVLQFVGQSDNIQSCKFAQTMEQRLQKAFQDAEKKVLSTTSNLTVEILNTSNASQAVTLTYAVRNQSSLLNGTVSSSLLSQLSAELVGFYLTYPPLTIAESLEYPNLDVSETTRDYWVITAVVKNPPNNLWIIAAVLAPIAVVTVIIIIITAVLCRKNKNDFKPDTMMNLPQRAKPVQGFDYAKQHLGQQGADEEVIPVTQETVVLPLPVRDAPGSQERETAQEGSTIKTAQSTETRKSRSPSENGSVLSNESGKPSPGRPSPQNVTAVATAQQQKKEEGRKRNGERGAGGQDCESPLARHTRASLLCLFCSRSARYHPELSKGVLQQMKNSVYRSRQSLNSPSPGETEMDLLVTRERPRRGIRNSGYDTEPEIIEETNIDRVNETRGYPRSRQVKGHSETSTLSSQPSIDEVRQQMHMLLEEAFSLASAGHGGQSRQQDTYGSAQHFPYSEVVTSAPGTMTRSRAGMQWVPTYRPEMYQYSLPRPAYRFSQLPEMVMGSPPPPVPPRTGPVAVASLRRSTSDIGSKTRMSESSGPEQAQLHDGTPFAQVSRGPVSVTPLDQSPLNYSGSTVPAVFAIPAANRPGFTGYFIPTPPSSYRNQAWMSYAGENELPGQWADSVPLPGYIEAYPRSRYQQTSPSRLPRQYSQPTNLHPSLEQAPMASTAASQQSLAENDTSDAPLTNISTAALVKAIREEVAKLAKKQTDMFEFQV